MVSKTNIVGEEYKENNEEEEFHSSFIDVSKAISAVKVWSDKGKINNIVFE